MALKGNLRDFSTTQLLNLINLARKTGMLTIESDGMTSHLFFKEGKLVLASLAGQDNQLTAVLQKSGKITPEQARVIKTRSQINTDKELGMLLINAGYISQEDILTSVRQQTLEVMYLLFTWTDGKFHFEPNQLPASDRISVPIDLENVIMEGSRRIKEWERLQDEVPDLDMALKFTDRPSARLRNISLSVDEWRVISFINPRNTIRQIAQYNGMNDFQIRKIVYGMLSAGLVELVEPEGVVRKRPARPGVPTTERAAEVARATEAQRTTEAPKPAAVKRNVILRLIDRIRRI
jgi:hypothetical protein